MKSSESRQLGFVFADNSKESELDPKADESGDVRFVVETLDGLSGENVGGWG
ncbi:hypothetical protein N9A80_01815 [Rhodopirellula sp.]|nr:hypothetical protein [Rhodopirellula sp.]